MFIITIYNIIETLHCSCKAYISTKFIFLPLVGAAVLCIAATILVPVCMVSVVAGFF